MDVTKTRELDLCTSCEICNAVCPVDEIEMKFKEGHFVPLVDEETCIDCEKCIDICPGIQIDLYEGENFERWLTGQYIEAYSAYTKNQKIWENSASGGAISQLLIKLLENGDYQGAFVLPFDMFEGKPGRLELANTEKEIKTAAKSKYIPASVFNIIKTLSEESNPNYVIVGTPCQLKGIRNFIDINEINDENLLFLGLFCEKTLNFNVLDYFEEKFSKKNEKLVKFDYKNKEKDGWPGHPKLYFDSGRELVSDRSERIKIKEHFQLERCLYCLDKLNRQADISFGDCYIRGKKNPGRSNIIIRTKKGKEVWEEYSHLFNSEKISVESIKRSQGISNKKKNLEFSKVLLDQEDFFEKEPKDYSRKTVKELEKRKKKISIGKKKNYSKLKRSLSKENLKDYTKFLREGGKLGLGLSSFYLKDTFSKNKYGKEKSTGDNVVIFGGGFANKGAQAMTLTVVDQMKKRFPDKDIYLFNSNVFARDGYEKNRYNLEILPWDPGTVINLLKEKRIIDLDAITSSEEIEKRLKNIIKNAALFLDISGYHFSSQMSGKKYDISPQLKNVSVPFSLGQYLYLMRIMIAKKYDIPYFILPQSIGPFDYDFVDKFFISTLMRRYLKYPVKIYPREPQGIQALKSFTKENIERQRDIVLLNDSYKLENVFRENFELDPINIEQNSVGIIPNNKVMERTNEDEIYQLYKKIIATLRKRGKTVYILMHSEEDYDIGRKLNTLFPNDEKVILVDEDLNGLELEKTIEQLDFIVGSRYHSIINAYKNAIPAVVLGWSLKYEELLKDFDQLDYIFDIRKDIREKAIISSIKKMLENFGKEHEKIKSILDKMEKNPVFEEIEQFLSG